MAYIVIADHSYDGHHTSCPNKVIVLLCYTFYCHSCALAVLVFFIPNVQVQNGANKGKGSYSLMGLKDPQRKIIMSKKLNSDQTLLKDQIVSWHLRVASISVIRDNSFCNLFLPVEQDLSKCLMFVYLVLSFLQFVNIKKRLVITLRL